MSLTRLPAVESGAVELILAAPLSPEGWGSESGRGPACFPQNPGCPGSRLSPCPCLLRRRRPRSLLPHRRPNGTRNPRPCTSPALPHLAESRPGTNRSRTLTLPRRPLRRCPRAPPVREGAALAKARTRNLLPKTRNRPGSRPIYYGRALCLATSAPGLPRIPPRRPPCGDQTNPIGPGPLLTRPVNPLRHRRRGPWILQPSQPQQTTQ